MRYLLLFLFLHIMVSLSWTQEEGQPVSSSSLYTDEDLKGLGQLGPMSPGVRTIDLRYEGVKGTPLIFKDWKNAALQLKGQEGFGNEVLVNIDGEKNLLYFQLAGGYVSSIPANKLNALKVEMGAEQYKVFKVISSLVVEGEKEPALKYYESLYDGKFQLLKLDARFLVKADYQGPYSPDIRYDEYTEMLSFWLMEEGGDFQKVKIKRKSIEQALPDHASQIKKLIKEKKLPLNEENDLVQLLKLLEKPKYQKNGDL